MSIVACAALVERGDPVRFAATMAAPVAARARLWPLYAYNLEIARAPFVTGEPMIAEMRLQWWVDTVARAGLGEHPAAHEVAGPLSDLIRDVPGLAPLLTAMAEARRRDCWPEAFAGDAALAAYLDATAGSLMWAAARVLGAGAGAEPVVRDFAAGAGLAQWLVAVAALRAMGRAPLPDPAPHGIAVLAHRGLTRIAAARRRRHLIDRAAIPALWTGWPARALLAQAVAQPERVLEGGLAVSPFRQRGGLLARAMTGFW